MPPPPPNFLPANRRRQPLDPTRHLKSRELWNKVRFHASASSYEQQHQQQQQGGANGGSSNTNSTPSNNNNNNIKWAISLIQAIAYELQPFRIKPAYRQVKIFICEEQGLQRLATSFVDKAKLIITLLAKLVNAIYQIMKQTNMTSIKSFFTTNQSLLTKMSALLVGLRLYYHTILYLHELLNAGPILVILTLLTLLYTIGLGDNTGAASGVPSAYSVFNRGMRRILGTVDAEELARQYAGGIALAAGGGGMNNNQIIDDFGDDEAWINEEEEEEEQNLVNERRRQRRLERLQQQRQEAENAVQQQQQGGPQGENNNDLVPELNNDDDIENEQGDDNNSNNNNNLNDQQNNPPTTANNGTTAAAAARKSGKKARRRNLELRREMQRQRQAAAALGFGAGGEGDDGRELEARMALE